MEQIHVIVIAFECLNYEQISSYLSLNIIRTDSRENYKACFWDGKVINQTLDWLENPCYRFLLAFLDLTVHNAQ